MQICVVRLLRNSFRSAARQDWDKIASLLRPIYFAAPRRPHSNVRRVRRHVGRTYPAIIRLWENDWVRGAPARSLGESSPPFLRFDTEIRRIVCAANAIDSVNVRIRPEATSRTIRPR
ncbi:transposase [Streptomyces sp. NPDC007355]|uniref:transposase n=1 Tax=Streptomyces sp. NPDC007355 TaxID=3364778 RepID=UPI00369B7EB7